MDDSPIGPMANVSRRDMLALSSTSIGAGALGAAGTASAQSGLLRGGRIDIADFGARGDRVADDGPAIMSAIAEAGRTDQYPKSVFIPAGNYRRNESIALPGHICLFGEGVSSILNSQNDTDFDQPILVNENPAGLVHARVESVSLYGGSHGLKLEAAAENADLRLTDVSMLLQSEANIEANKLFQTAKLINCSFADARYGIKVNGTGANCCIATGCEWLNHSVSAIYLRGSDGFTIIGGRFEGGGRKGAYALDIENASNILFIGCFFENVHEFLGRFRDIAGAVVFQSCHFTGTSLDGGPLRPFRWDTADTQILFRDCASYVPMAVDGTIRLEGANPGITAADVLLEGSDQKGRMTRFAQQPSADGCLRIASFGAGDIHLSATLSITARSARLREATSFVLENRAVEWIGPAPTSFGLRVEPGEDGTILACVLREGSVTEVAWTIEWTALSPEESFTVRPVD